MKIFLQKSGIIVLALFLFAGCGSDNKNSNNPQKDLVAEDMITDLPSLMFEEKMYLMLVSPNTQRVWLDRNLGADESCSSPEDIACVGDYYQWGRATDGHQKMDSPLQSEASPSINNIGDLFITNRVDWTTADENGSERILFWSKSDGNGICPNGFRVPTMNELEAEFDMESEEGEDIAEHFLKPSLAGFRNLRDGLLTDVGVEGSLWSYDFTRAMSADALFITPYGAGGTSTGRRGFGYSIRCIAPLIETTDIKIEDDFVIESD